jgi:hypothetical protein
MAFLAVLLLGEHSILLVSRVYEEDVRPKAVILAILLETG